MKKYQNETMCCSLELNEWDDKKVHQDLWNETWDSFDSCEFAFRIGDLFLSRE